MNKAQQIKFINNLTNAIKLDIINKIEYDKIPDNWDGVELRQLLADKFAVEVMRGDWRDKRNSRRKEFERVCIVENI